jgi:hypothetical protein
MSLIHDPRIKLLSSSFPLLWNHIYRLSYAGAYFLYEFDKGTWAARASTLDQSAGKGDRQPFSGLQTRGALRGSFASFAGFAEPAVHLLYDPLVIRYILACQRRGRSSSAIPINPPTPLTSNLICMSAPALPDRVTSRLNSNKRLKTHSISKQDAFVGISYSAI